MTGLPKRQRVAAYAVILRDGEILLSRLAESVTPDELWTLPGGGLDHGEDPRDAVVREIREETGLAIRQVSRRGELRGSDYAIHCFCGEGDFDKDLKPREGETEVPRWVTWKEAVRDDRLMPNLRVVVPLMMAGVEGWVLEGDDVLEYRKHVMTVSFS